MITVIIIIFSLSRHVDSQCTSWSNMANLGSPGGNYQGTKTIAECQSLCLYYSNCQYGFDFVDATRQCWISTTYSTSYMNGVQHWSCAYNSGSCNDFKETLERSVSGGTKFGSAITLDGCKAACVAQPTCNSLDFNPSVSECWLLTVTGPQRYDSRVNHYDLNRSACTSGQTPAITPSSGCLGSINYVTNTTSVSYGATPFPSLRTEANCQAACTFDVTCLSYQLDFNAGPSSYCWLQKSSLTLGRPVANVVEKIKICDTTANTPAACQPTFAQTANKHFIGGILNAAETSVDGCQAACVRQTNCIGVDFNTVANPDECWILTQTTVLTDAVGVYHYDINRNPPNCNTKSQYSLYTLTKDYKMPGGSKSSSSSTLEACKVECANAPTCVGFDFNRMVNPSECWLLYTTVTLVYNQGVDHYDLTRAQSLRLSSEETCPASPNNSASKILPTPVNITDQIGCIRFCRSSPSCTFGAIWDADAPLGQRCAYAMKYCLYSTPGFVYYEYVEGKVFEVENVTSEFLGRATSDTRAIDCKHGCNSIVPRLVWSARDNRCRVVQPNEIVPKAGHTFYKCEK